MRVAKAIARAGICSRRAAERLIEEGRVQVNGATIASPALNVEAADKVAIDGEPLPGPEPVRLWRYHKPRGLMTTHSDPKGRPTVFERLKDELPRVISVGRLDVGTEGLLLLTTDGDLARHLELPETGWMRRYRVRARGRVEPRILDNLSKGIEVEGIKYGPIEAQIERAEAANIWLKVALREGKNREVKRVMAHLGLAVNRLIRVSYGPFQLGDLAPGAFDEVRRRVLAEQLGPEQASALGLASPRAGRIRSKTRSKFKGPART